MLQKVNKGERLRIPADAYNAFIDAALRANPDGVSSTDLDLPQAYSVSIALVRNDSGATRARFDAVGLAAPLIPPASNLKEFQRQPMFSAVIPAAASHIGKFGILLEPLAAGKIGTAMVAGVCPAQLTGADVGFAEIQTGSSILVADPSGSAKVLWTDSGSGTRWALIRLGTPAPGLSSDGSYHFPHPVIFTSRVTVPVGGGPVVLSSGVPVVLKGSETLGYTTLSTWTADPGVVDLSTGSGQTHILRASTTLPNVNLTGFIPGLDPDTGSGNAARLIKLFNDSASYTNLITLKHNDATAGVNKFLLPGEADLKLYRYDGVNLWYDPASSAWLVVGKTGLYIEADDSSVIAPTAQRLRFKASDFAVTSASRDDANIALTSAPAASGFYSACYQSTGQAVAANSATTLHWSMANENPSGFFVSPDHFTVPTGKAGIYLCTVSAAWGTPAA